MTTNIYELFKDHIELPADYTECLWYVRYDQVTWTEGDELSDLFNGDGDTYSCEVKEMGKEIGEEGVQMVVGCSIGKCLTLPLKLIDYVLNSFFYVTNDSFPFQYPWLFR